MRSFQRLFVDIHRYKLFCAMLQLWLRVFCWSRSRSVARSIAISLFLKFHLLCLALRHLAHYDIVVVVVVVTVNFYDTLSQWHRQDLLRGGAKLDIGALTADFRAGCSSCLMTNSFMTNAVLIERAVSCWHLQQLILQTTQYSDSWLSDLFQSKLKMNLLEVEGHVPRSWRRHCTVCDFNL